MGRNLIAGDIHGQYGLLMEALEKASFDPVSDTLYFTGDLADRGSGSALVIRFLMSLPSCHGVLGNHDIWLENYLLDDAMPAIWLDMNGGNMTVASYMENRISNEEKALHGLWLRNIPLCIHTSKYIITAIMFIGRLGALTIITMWINRPEQQARYTEESITIG